MEGPAIEDTYEGDWWVLSEKQRLPSKPKMNEKTVGENELCFDQNDNVKFSKKQPKTWSKHRFLLKTTENEVRM